MLHVSVQEQHAEQKRLRGINAQLQHKIAEYLARKKVSVSALL